MKRTACALAAIIPMCWSANAIAAGAPAICANPAYVRAAMDKDVFAEEMLIQAGVSAVVRVRFDAWRKDNPNDPKFAGLTSRAAMAVYGAEICDSIGCTPEEGPKVAKASQIFYATLTDTAHFSFVGWRDDPAAFMRDGGGSIRCRASTTVNLAIIPPLSAGSTKPPQSAWGLNDRVAGKDRPTGSIRIRGKGDDLIYAQYDAGFTDASKANISFEHDDTTSKGSTNLVGAVGYSILFPGAFNENRTRRVSWGLIPYFGVDLETSKTKRKAREYDSDTFDVGTTFQMVEDTYSFRFKRAASQFLAFTPHFLINRDDKSRLLAVNLLYRPTISFSPSLAVNGFSNIDLGDIPLKWEPILDGRFAYGHFTRAGLRTGDDANDFTRIGFRYGIGLSSRVDRFPVDLVVTDTPMFVIDGASRDISIFESTLSMFFDADKRFGTEVKFAKGRATDLDERVAKWSLGLAVRY